MYKGKVIDLSAMEDEKPLDHVKDEGFAVLSCRVFLLTIIAMASRPIFGCCLGFISICGAVTLIFFFEIFKKSFTIEIPDVKHVLSELDWRAIFFYVALFALVGGLEHAGVIKLIGGAITPLVKSSLVAGSTLLYWVTAPLVRIVEHDAHILSGVYIIRDLGKEHAMNRCASMGVSSQLTCWEVI